MRDKRITPTNLMLLIASTFFAVAAAVGWIMWFLSGSTNAITADASRPSQLPNIEQSRALASGQEDLKIKHAAFSPIRYIFSVHPTPLPELQTWLRTWELKSLINESQLQTSIQKSDLSAEECLQIGAVVGHVGDYPTAKLFVSEGYLRAKHGQGHEIDAKHRRSLVGLLIQGQDSLQSRNDASHLIEEMSRLIIDLDKDKDWDHTRELAELRLLRLLIIDENYSEAVAVAAAISKDSVANRNWSKTDAAEFSLISAHIPLCPTAISPLDVLANHHPTPSLLQAWLEQWQKNNSAGKADPNDPSALYNAGRSLALAKSTDLSAEECLRIAELMRAVGDVVECEAFADLGADRAKGELKNKAHDDVSVYRLMNALVRAEDCLWNSDGNSTERGETIEKMTTLLIPFDREKPWDRRPELARIGHAESLLLQERYGEALAEANHLAVAAPSDSNFTDQMKGAVAWLQGLVLFDLNRFAEAAPHLEYAARQTESPHSKAAWPMWVEALAKAGETQHANTAFNEWIERDKPSLDSATNVMEVVQAAAPPTSNKNSDGSR